MISITHLMTGAVQPLGPQATPSGIAKHTVSGRLWLGRDGLTGDAHGDPKHHGGPEKAVHHYAFDHYTPWCEDIGARDVLTQPGAFGENFSSRGLTEAEIAIGDTFRMGEALLQVSQGRQPCWKLNVRFDVPDMSRRVQSTGRTGWYYRVLEEGFVAAGDELVLVDRISPEWTIGRLQRTLYIDTLNVEELAAMAALAHLPDSWRRYATRRLETRQVEDWSSRLTGGKNL